MLGGNSDAAWERYGRADPYFGVVAHDRFHGERLDEDARAEFFRSGEEHIRSVLETVHRRIDPTFMPTRALDFGCGVGRLILPLSHACTRVVGADVSDSMLREARRNCEARSITNVELVRSDDRLSAVTGDFDFIHSFIVFQHIPPERGVVILRAMMDRLVDGGVGVLHFTYARRAPALRRLVHRMRKSVPLVNGIVNIVQGRSFLYPMMQMNHYSLNRVFSVLDESGCGGAYARFTDHGGHLGAILFFQKNAAGRAFQGG